MANLSLMNVQNWWATQPSLTALVPQSNVWIDLAGDASFLPYVIFKQLGTMQIWNTSGSLIGKTRFQVIVYAVTLAYVDMVVGAVEAAMARVPGLTPLAYDVRRDNVVVRAEPPGAYSCTLEFMLFENQPH